jgi:hypothetical protein
MDGNFFTIGKSAVNFCEYDSYAFGYIGEPWNVLTSMLMVFFGLYGLYNINYKFISQKNKLLESHKTQSNILYVLLSCIGLGSMFFHSYLSPFAHWVDIIFISIILLYSQYILSSDKDKLINKLKYFGLMIIHFGTSIFIPQIHIFLLFGTGFIIKKLIDNKIKLNNLTNTNLDSKLEQKYWWIKKYFFIGLLLWIIDYFGCEFITPYHVHWIFHIFIGLVSYKIIGLIKYL